MSELGKASQKLHNAEHHFESTRKKLKLYHGRINLLRAELKQVGVKESEFEQKLAAATLALDAARCEFKRLRHEDWLLKNTKGESR